MLIDETTLKNTIFLVDDDENILESLNDIFEIFGFKTETYSSAVDYLRELDGRQGCLVCDISMPEMTGIELLAELNKVEHSRPTLFLTGVATIDIAVEAMALGAMGFMEKPVATEVLLKKVIDAIENFKPILETIQHYKTLTPKERPVFDLIVKGVTNHDIAEQLGLSISTIEKHRASVMKKMQADSLAILMIKLPNLRPLGSSLECNNL